MVDKDFKETIDNLVYTVLNDEDFANNFRLNLLTELSFIHNFIRNKTEAYNNQEVEVETMEQFSTLYALEKSINSIYEQTLRLDNKRLEMLSKLYSIIDLSNMSNKCKQLQDKIGDY